eukprot:COSAG01_NODE_2533_length_7491_cov_236.560741_2_plen_67_part_00
MADEALELGGDFTYVAEADQLEGLLGTVAASSSTVRSVTSRTGAAARVERAGWRPARLCCWAVVRM